MNEPPPHLPMVSRSSGKIAAGAGYRQAPFDQQLLIDGGPPARCGTRTAPEKATSNGPSVIWEVAHVTSGNLFRDSVGNPCFGIKRRVGREPSCTRDRRIRVPFGDGAAQSCQ